MYYLQNILLENFEILKFIKNISIFCHQLIKTHTDSVNQTGRS